MLALRSSTSNSNPPIPTSSSTATPSPSIQTSPQQPQQPAYTLNVLPCRIAHTGPAKVTKRYWSPQTREDGSRIAYFRGRRLLGRAVKLPSGYGGVVGRRTEAVLQSEEKKQPVAMQRRNEDELEDADDDDDDDEDLEPEPAITIMEEVGSFSDVVVWGHDQLPGVNDGDVYVRGMEEWIGVAETVHGKPWSEKGGKEVVMDKV